MSKPFSTSRFIYLLASFVHDIFVLNIGTLGKILLTHLFSKINTMIAITLPIPRKIYAGNTNYKNLSTNFNNECLPI